MTSPTPHARRGPSWHAGLHAPTPLSLSFADSSTATLLDVLLGSGARPQPGRTLLESAGSLRVLARLSPAQLAHQGQLSAKRASQLAAALELGRRALSEELCSEPLRFADVDAVARWATPRLLLLEHEEVWLLCLDGRHRLRAARCVARGGLHGCSLMARDVLREALKAAASAIILLHNHPSGDPSPSPEDIELTRRLAAAARVIGTPLLDHVIVARGGTSSLRGLGLFEGR